MSYYNLVIIIILFVLVGSLIYGDFTNQRFLSLNTDQIGVSLCMVMLLLLWYNDILSLGMGIKGIMTKKGIYQIMRSQISAIYLFLINGLSMLAISLWLLVKNFNNNLVFWALVLLFGVIIFLTISIYLGRFGEDSEIWRMHVITTYHIILLFIIVPSLVIATSIVSG